LQLWSPKRLIGETFVLAGKDAVTTNEMIQKIAQAFGKNMPRFRMPLLPFELVAVVMETVLRPLGIQPPLHRRRMNFFKKSFLFSLDKASKRLDFSPKISFKTGVDLTARWYERMGYL